MIIKRISMRGKISGMNENKVTQRLKKLIEASQYFAEIESLDELFPRLLELARNVTDAEAASLLMYNPEYNILEFASIADEVLDLDGIETLKKSVKVKVGEGISGWVAQNRKPLIIEDAQNDARFSNLADKKTGFITRSLLSVPLIYHNDLLGVINAVNAKTKPCFDIEDQEILVSYARLASVAIIRSKLIEARLKQQSLEIQLTTAAKIQSLFWPKIPRLGHKSHAWAISLPAAFVGGDLYDIIPIGDGSWIIYVADVSDKGLPAAMIMVALWSKIRSEAPFHDDIEALLETVNSAMYDLMSEEGFFATIILGRYWPENGKLNFIHGGHLFPLWIIDGTLQNLPTQKGLSLGIKKQTPYLKKEITLSPGESVLFLSDGVTEAENEQNDLFGTQRVAEQIRKISGPPWSKTLLNTIRDWQGNAKPSDDLTMLEIWRDPD